jgi:hypothetical protein
VRIPISPPRRELKRIKRHAVPVKMAEQFVFAASVARSPAKGVQNLTIYTELSNLNVRPNRRNPFRSSSMAEHSAVNRRVVSSSLTCGATLNLIIPIVRDEKDGDQMPSFLFAGLNVGLRTADFELFNWVFVDSLRAKASAELFFGIRV